MAKHKKQHFVPRSYLRAWCDPNTPAVQQPYVWRFSKDGSASRRRAPESIFHESDMYTIPMPDGSRDLRLEHGLKQLEDEFVNLRDKTLAVHREPDLRERVMLCAFVAASHARTPTQRDHWSAIWRQVLEKADAVRAQFGPDLEERKAPASTPPGPSRRNLTFSYDDVRAMMERPIESSLWPMVQAQTPLLAQLDMVVLITTDSPGFITSDNPCVWCDPEAPKRPPFYQPVGLQYDSIEISLPISPRQLLLLNRRGATGYASAPQRLLDEMNRRTRAYCAEYFVTNSQVMRPVWFELGKEPEDSWRKVHGDEDAEPV
jgi:hypothetical protein